MVNASLLLKQLEVTRVSNTVIRNHTTVTNGQPTAYNVGNHVGGVIQLLLLLFPKASTALVRIMAFHDYQEAVTGDVIGSAKVKFPKLRDVLEEIETAVDEEYKIIDGCELSDLEWIIHDLVDRGELLLWCYEQYECGCRTPRFLKMLNRVSEKVYDLIVNFRKNILKNATAYDKHLLEGVNAFEVVLTAINPVKAK
jgi:hypothetical protein